MSSSDQPSAPTPAPARRSALFIAPALVGAVEPTALAFLMRMNRAGVVLMTWSLPAVDGLAAQGVAASLLLITTPSPTPKAYLAALRQDRLDDRTSWLVTGDPAEIAAAATAGLGGAVLVAATPPAGEQGIHLVRALTLADVPRVLIPREGGCWHQQ